MAETSRPGPDASRVQRQDQPDDLLPHDHADQELSLRGADRWNAAKRRPGRPGEETSLDWRTRKATRKAAVSAEELEDVRAKLRALIG